MSLAPPRLASSVASVFSIPYYQFVLKSKWILLSDAHVRNNLLWRNLKLERYSSGQVSVPAIIYMRKYFEVWFFQKLDPIIHTFCSQRPRHKIFLWPTWEAIWLSDPTVRFWSSLHTGLSSASRTQRNSVCFQESLCLFWLCEPLSMGVRCRLIETPEGSSEDWLGCLEGDCQSPESLHPRKDLGITGQVGS